MYSHPSDRREAGIRRGWIWNFCGAPIFLLQVPKPLSKHFGTSGRKSGCPKNAKSDHDGSNPPFSALWTQMNSPKISAKCLENHSSKKISSLVLAREQLPAPRVFAQNLIPQEIVPAYIGLCRRVHWTPDECYPGLKLPFKPFSTFSDLLAERL